MKILRSSSGALSIEDRTERALWASTVAPTLQGAPPKAFIGSLYPYQLDGFRWLSFMAQSGLGCIVADEMGLGKTIQVICLLLEAVEQKRRPNLVISPATVLENWRRELARFAPLLHVLVHSGSQRTGFPDKLLCHDVVITSFETAVADISLLRNVQWNVVVVDEAQGIKNPDAKRTIQLKTLPRTCAVAVTGTPVENRLKDLWSIADFVLPSLLGSLSEFEIRHPDTVEGAAVLEPIVSPLILRRSVVEVASDLPERIDIPQPLELDDASAQAYEIIRAEASSGKGSAGLAAVTTLRMFCTHPWLTGHLLNVGDAVRCSTKLSRLFEVIEEMAMGGGKAIIFTSYHESINLLVSEINAHFGIPVDFIDGRIAVPLRQQKVDALAATEAAAVLVLNPKAAGTGLNITAANHVIHFNLEWNPAVEDQASARSHRRGQARAVTVHRFFYVNTIEEIINDRMQRKRQLATTAVVGTDGQAQEMDDILRALRISPVSHH
ncbi:MAG: DEAD/DEAH box helicase [Thermodesulfovibrionales bacterium]|jgi:SNF2 family DNA or RNA helicase